ncbi:protein kinase superfamily protein [Striga asiatica]|uniref:non-specific serine/threonine protein kinase n=1 Tax=Striga asiatica TaxID=4170 RepID=A0A5A7R9N4_STRAF|nr:protein kinase superfamily protein [Striga asiatica]
MKCFQFHIGDKKEDQKSTTKPNSGLSSFADHEVRQFGSELNSQNASDTSSESRGRNQFPNMSERSSNLKDFTFSELKQATKNFSRTAKLGEGGFGCVFKGVIRSSEDPSKKIDVAVKQLGRRGLQGHKEWVTEVNVLGIVEHPNLVKLIGYCAEDDERGIQRLLIYEYMPNGSVEDHLSVRSISTPLSWEMRLKIALDAARGLAYLHEEMDFQIIFRDFKSSNILLDEQWNAKLSDFGLARLGPAEGLTHVSTAVVGTLGYAAPEYVHTGRLTSKSDVWSFGVFLYELITGRRPLDRNRPRSEQKLLEWVKPYLSDAKKFQMILDPRLTNEGSKQVLRSAHKLSLVANRCLARLPKARPTMGEVREMISQVVEASSSANGGAHEGLLPQPAVRGSGGKVGKNIFFRKNEGKGKGRMVDLKFGDGGWLVRVWTSKLVRTC